MRDCGAGVAGDLVVEGVRVMAGFCNFICPGLGHLILGKPFSGFLWFVVIACAYVAAALTAGIGLLVAVPLHLLCIMRAGTIDRKQSEASMERAVRRARSKP